MTRRQQIANLLVAVAMVTATGWICSAVFGQLGKQPDWSKAWENQESLWRGWLVTLGIIRQRVER